MEHFTVDQTCKHGGCEMAIRFVNFVNGLAKQPVYPAGTINTHVCLTRQPTNPADVMTTYDFFAAISRPALMRSRMSSRSLSSFNFVMTTLDG
jgi:hypothetical protein